MTADATFAERAAARLRKILDEHGYPFDLLGRSNAVSAKLGITDQAGQQILSGIVPWTWTQLETVCMAFQKEPGYFLDKDFSASLPTDTVAVTSSDGGETIAIRAPKGFLRSSGTPGTRLRYLTERSEASSFKQGSLLIYAEVGMDPGDVQAGNSYVVAHHENLEVMRCQSVSAAVASFEPVTRRGVALIVPFEVREDSAEARIVGRVVATLAAE